VRVVSIECVGETFSQLANALAAQPDSVWEMPSLCAGWRVREVIAHVTMFGRMTDEEFDTELARFGGDFQRLSDLVAGRDAELPIDVHLGNLQSDALARWQPPGGGVLGALHHAVVHALDVTNAAEMERPCSDEVALAILGNLTTNEVALRFDVRLDDLCLCATDLTWTGGGGESEIVGTSGHLISLLSGRTLKGGQCLAPQDQ
jgi:uncharacterized protein (TIGR03083 family)